MKDSTDPSATPSAHSMPRPAFPGGFDPAARCCQGALSPASSSNHSARGRTWGSSSAPPWRGGGVHTPAQESQSSCAERKLRDELEHMALKERVSFCVSEKLLSSHTPGARSLPGSFVCCVSDGGRWGPLDDSPNSEKVTGGLGKPPIHYSGVGSSPARPRGHRWSQLRGPTPMSTEAPPQPPAFTPGKAPLGGDGPTPDRVGVGCTCLAEQSHPCLASPRVTCGQLWAQEGHPDLRSPLLQELKARSWFPLRLSLSDCGFSNCT